ncbi:MAG: type V CRISPR-associated protein Cas12a/Cpf1, partial [Acutalibacteraceae bacterium]|nr:type V CRISPR-associated protein Cas12a/Cpf1 [Acutalibacteraceae bacterium]
ISEFYREVSNQAYTIRFKDVPVDYIDGLVERGQLYLFQIYNKDFSAHSKGTPNLHTLYFKMLFDERNLSDVVFKLNGQSEMFYREASINKDEMIIHPANQPIDNKNPESSNKKAFFTYDIVKDKRFTKRQFLLHMPITINYKADGKEIINDDVRKAIKHSDKTHIIGIDRGERNLLYICVIDSDGNIVEQKSLNEIFASTGQRVDYHKLLDKKEGERDKARKNWSTIENIKELKEGYLSQVVHEICKLVVKYNALVALEDLNFGFKKGRFKVEKQVYQKFENMLIQKLNYLADKNIDPNEDGGLLKAYQLTNCYKGVSRGKQNGIIFYVPAYLTSKIDPTTGFVDLLKPKYTNVSDSVSFFERFDDIVFNSSENIFEFKLDYTKFPRTDSSFVKKWTLFSNGERIMTFRNSLKNNEWDNKTVVLTDEFKSLFEKYGIDYTSALKKSIVENGDKNFHKELIRLVSLMLQMRNSETGNFDVDYLISPVKNSSGGFYDSRCCMDNLPQNADANGAYNIARKALWAVGVMKNTPDEGLMKANLAISNADWLGYAQNEDKDLLIVNQYCNPES